VGVKERLRRVRLRPHIPPHFLFTPFTFCLPFIKVAQENHNDGCAHAPSPLSTEERFLPGGIAGLSALGVVIAHALRRGIFFDEQRRNGRAKGKASGK